MGLYTHLFSVHKIDLRTSTTLTSTPDKPPKEISKRLINYFPILGREEKSFPATLARLTALDGIPFNVISFL